MEFHQRLKECRKSKGLTQKQMAQLLGISANHYQNYEYGKHQPTLDKLKLIAKSLNVTTDYLLCMDEF